MKPPGPFLEVLSSSADPDPELDGLLFAARESAEPTSDNRERVSLALRSALPALHVPGAPAATRTGGGSETPAQAPSGQPGSLAAARHGGAESSRWLLLGGIVLGALGFWVGRDLGYAQGLAHGLAQRLANEVGTTGSRGASATPAGLEAPAPIAASPPGLAAPAPALTPDAAAGGDAPPLRAEGSAPRGSLPRGSLPRGSLSLAAPRGPASRGSLPRRARGHARLEVPATALAPAPTLSFREALEQLRRAQQQLQNGQAAMSLLVLSELDRNAGELLFEERETTRVLALCSAGQEKAARTAAEALRQKNPRSIYAMRLAQSCITDDATNEAAEYTRALGSSF